MRERLHLTREKRRQSRLNPGRSPRRQGRSRLAWTALFLLLTALPLERVWAACSIYTGYATINEVHRSGNSGDHFVEVKLLDGSLTAAQFGSWTVQACNRGGQCSGRLPLSGANASTDPWIVMGSSQITNSGWLDLKNGMDVILRDGAGNTIDYLSVVNVRRLQDASCAPAFDWTADQTDNNTHTVKREPDGTGDWADASGNSEKDTVGDTNNGSGLPALTGNDVTVTRGQTAVFALSLSAPAAGPVTIGYETRDLTALQGVDYVATSGSVTIPAGASSVTISVPTLSTSAADGQQFHLVLTAVANASVADHYLLATINAPPIPAPLANWRMEEGAGAATAVDSSGNGHNGTRTGWASTDGTAPAIPGDPGTCRYGTFEDAWWGGSAITAPSFPHLTGEFTFTSWVYTTSTSSNQTLVDDYDYKFLLPWLAREGYALLLDDFSGGLGRLKVHVSDASYSSGRVIATNRWYFIALSLKPISATSTRVTLTALDSAGGVVTSVSQILATGMTANTGALALGSSTFRVYPLLGRLDEVTYFGAELSLRQLQEVRQRTHPCAGSPIHHFELGHAASASTCAPEPITVTACANSSCTTTYAGDVQISLSPQGWVGGDTHTLSGGAATLQLAREAAGEVTLGILASSVPADQPLVCRIGGVASDCRITFRDNMFVIDSVDALADVAVAARPHRMRARLFTRDPATGAQCTVATGYSGAKNLKAWYLPEPLHPAGATAPAIGATPLPSAGSAALTLSFSAGEAEFDLYTSDVGRFRLGLLDDTRTFATTTDISGTSSVQTVRPFGFDIDFSGDRAANGTLGSSYAADAAGSVFVAAGESFQTTLRAVLWEAADDADGDGVPDAAAKLTDNGVTPRFSDSVNLTRALKLPVGGSPGVLSGGSGVASFSGGVATTALAWSEVGIIDLSAGLASGSYLGSGADVTGTALNVGRFRPHRFTVSFSGSPAFAAACGGFTYLGQPFQFDTAPGVTVTAVNAAGATTANYEGAFWKLGAALTAGSNSVAYSSNLAGSTLVAPAAAVGFGPVADADGQVSVSLHPGEDFLYARPALPVAPHDADVRLTVVADDGEASGSGEIAHIGFAGDAPLGADGVAGTADDDFISPNNALLRFGRLRLLSGYGPETRAVTVPVRAEYFNGTGFIANGDDGCTSLDLAGQFQLSNEDTAGGAPQPGNAVMSLDAGTTSGSLDYVPMLGGRSGLRFSAPGSGNTGRVNVDLNLASQPWLRFDWDGDGAHDDDPPAAQANFGIYRGSDKVIYIREVY